ncbi:MAG: hypothetical protein P8L18_10495 [Verrucomicrobiota bacterium]|jgi:hypothetical protein|nr:hypothetical protein [Verrucomicrobiota bacterium]
MWQNLWTIVFFTAIAGFAGMALWVTIGGFKDLKRLFQRLNEDLEEEEE